MDVLARFIGYAIITVMLVAGCFGCLALAALVASGR
jgi:hypothetical protein